MGRSNIYMPSLGEGIIEASVIKILKNVGETVEEDDPVIEIATDKVDSEIVALEKGVIEEITVKPGDIVKVGEVVAILKTERTSEEFHPSVKGPEGEESFVLNKDEFADTTTKEKENFLKKEITSKEPPDNQYEKDRKENKDKVFSPQESSKEASKSPIQEAVSHSETPKKIFLSPLVKNIMKEEGLSYEEVASLDGSGYMGRITKDDILKYVRYKKEGALHGEELKEITVSSTVSQKERSSESKNKKETLANNKKEKFVPYEKEETTEGYSEQEMDRVRMLIAKHTLESKKISPHVTSFIEVDISTFIKIRKEYKEKYFNNYGIKLTYTTLFIAATAIALEKFPEINSSISGNKIRYFHNINIGIATALNNGNLIVPVIKNIEKLNLKGIIEKLEDLTKKAKTNSLEPEDIVGGTFTITNYGIFNTIAGTPIIVQPQSAILGIGKIKKRAVVVESNFGDSIAIKPIAIISLSFDHRIIDGALAGKFLGYLQECIENYKI